MALADDIFGSGTPSDFDLDPRFQFGSSADRFGEGFIRRELRNRALERIRATDPLFRSLSDLLQGSVIGSQDILGSEFGRAGFFNDLFTPEQRAREDLAAQERSQLLRGQNQDTFGRILQLTQAGPQLTPDQAARIRDATDLAIQSGLSDLGRFRDQTFDRIRQSAASRGLRPSDSPVVHQLTDLGEQLGRQAQGLTTDLRTQQLLRELEFPLQSFQANLGGLAAASDVGARERAFEQNLIDQAQATRLGLASGATSGAENLAISQSPADTFGKVRPLQFPESDSGGSDLDTILGGVGGLASGIGGLIAGGGALSPLLALSDERAKEEIEPVDAKAILDRIRGVRYRYRNPKNGEGEQVGILAQDLIAAGLGGAVVEDSEGMLRVDTGKVALPTLGLLAALNERVSELEARDA